MQLENFNSIYHNNLSIKEIWLNNKIVWSLSGPYWVGLGSDDNWMTANNWSNSTTPTANSLLTFAGTTRLSAFNNFTADTQFSAITFNSTAGEFRLTGNSFVIGNNGFTNNSTNLQTINNNIKLSSGNNQINTYSGDLAFNGILSQNGSIIKNGSGTALLRGANTYTGKTIVSQGTLATTTANRISDSSIVEVQSGATFTIGGSETIASLEGDGTVLFGANSLTISSANSATFVGLLSGSSGLFSKLGTGTQILGGTTSSGGSILIKGGSLVISAGTHTQTKAANPRNLQLSNALADTSTLTISGGTLTVTGLFMGENGGGTSTINCNGGTFQNNSQSWQAGVLSTLNINGGTFSSQGFDLGGGSGTTTSIVNLNSGVMTLTSALRWGLVGGATSTSTFSLNGGTFNCNSFLRSGGTNTFNFNGGLFVATINLTLPSPFNYIVQSGGANLWINSGVTLTTAGLSDGGGGGGVTKLGPGILALNGTLGYTGATSILAGSVRSVRTNGGTSPATVTGTATFTNTTLSVSFNVAPSIGMTFKFFPTSTTQSYPAVSLIGAPDRSASYDSSTSTLTIIS